MWVGPLQGAPRIGSGAGRVIEFGIVRRTVFVRGEGVTDSDEAGEESESDPRGEDGSNRGKSEMPLTNGGSHLSGG
jgi:hypothetical protein